LSGKIKMKRAVVVILLLSFLAGCSKNKNTFITATVVAQQSCTPNAWLVRVDKPNPKFHSFLCGADVSIVSSAIYNCGNSAFILNMPAAFMQDGRKVKFSKWEDKGLLCFSSTLAPHHLEVSDLSEQ
jgi:hypothetical protein